MKLCNKNGLGLEWVEWYWQFISTRLYRRNSFLLKLIGWFEMLGKLISHYQEQIKPFYLEPLKKNGLLFIAREVFATEK